MVASVTSLQSLPGTEYRENMTQDSLATENRRNVHQYRDDIENRTNIMSPGRDTSSPLTSEFEEEEEEEKEVNGFIRPIIKRKLSDNYTNRNGDKVHERVWSPIKHQLHVRFKGLEMSESAENLHDFKELRHSKSGQKFPVDLEKPKILLDDIRSICMWRAVLAEFLGTLTLVFVGCGSWIQRWTGDIVMTIKIDDATVQSTSNFSSTDVIQIALAFGLSVATIIWVIGHISGGHINPAVTCSMLITRRVSLARAFLFIVAQLFGSVVGAGILMGVTPKEKHETLGCTLLGHGVNDVMGVVVELFITFVLVLTVYASCDKHRMDLAGSFPLTIGLSVTMCHLFAFKFTGSSMNTARSFGPVVITGIWKDHWVYWVGPILGGILAGLLYDNVFRMSASLEVCRVCFFSSRYHSENLAEKKFVVRQREEKDYEMVELNENCSLSAKKDKSDITSNL
ncbi:hypothetical protein CHS0354_023403 [Potamilus streckersoni]|uniref:Uncharacterized protein n=1 Tax=Potamilus streckersoni TaxID=2493646 RepID=A0AAE0WAE1_9BIVA|nr:hypothetical protein CHS0354_023403 [Potamilus streckersoni]